MRYLKHAYDLSDEAVCERWLENPYWRRRFPEKAIAYPTENCLLEVARKKLVLLAKRRGFALRQSDARQGPALNRKAGRYAHARQFKRMRRILRRQRTVLGRVQRKLDQVDTDVRERIAVWLQRAQQVHAQPPKDKRKLDALHAPGVDCIGKGKARQPYAFGVKVGIAVSACKCSIVGARSSGQRRKTAGCVVAGAKAPKAMRCKCLVCAAGYNLRWLMRWIAFLRAWIRAMGWASLSADHRSSLAIGAWCLVLGAWCLVLGAWCLVLGAWCLKGVFQGRLVIAMVV
ncbi:IS1478 transposase [Xanthomonas fragariae]|uniref:IS1478 transposase n=2 Tax=Xanthomonas fragariae TaxID=48664 RepID=A0A1Y6HL42_9XANT|nr:IS1478 transposase [Xanthomonas fragariae]